MPLTPADVHNVAFKKPPIGKRGFDEEEVDAFLDEVERELARLIEENNQLRAQVERGGSYGGLSAGSDDEPRMVAELSRMKSQLDRLQRDAASADQAARAMQAELDQVRGMGGPGGGGGDSDQAVRVLMMAQRTADDHVVDARREAEGVLSEARSRAAEVTGDARAKADALERDARQRHQEAMGGLDAKRSATLKHIEELENFEREYRTRLMAYLESQLRDHGAPGQAAQEQLTS
jgi:DivIVA domain-containing protein